TESRTSHSWNMTFARRPMATANRGEVSLVDLGYTAKTCPGLVLSTPPLDTDRALATLIPHTTSPSGTRFEVPISLPFLDKSGFFDAQNPTSTPVKTEEKAGRPHCGPTCTSRGRGSRVARTVMLGETR